MVNHAISTEESLAGRWHEGWLVWVRCVRINKWFYFVLPKVDTALV